MALAEKETAEQEFNELAIKYRDLEGDFLDVDKKKKEKKEKIYQEIFHSNDIENIRSSNESGIFMKKIEDLEQKNAALCSKLSESQKNYLLKIDGFLK